MIVGLLFTTVMILMMRSVQLMGTSEPILPSFMGITAQGIGSVGMILNFVVTIVVSRMTDPPPEEIQEMVESVRIPSGAGTAVAH
jgi:cation/acetate symporter